MVQYWLCVTNEENWKVVKRKLVWGVPEARKALIDQVKKGDFLAFYVSPKRLAGAFKVASKPYMDRRKLFPYKGRYGREIYPWRVKIEPVAVPKKPVPFEDLVPKLKFIRKKTAWTAYVRRAMQKIPAEDFDVMVKALEKA